MFLIVIDAYSKWLEVRIMKSTTSVAIFSTLRSIFAQPSIIVTDNARNFVSAEFEQFLVENGIKHLMSPPYHPSSNGLAERAVQSFKGLCQSWNTVLYKIESLMYSFLVTSLQNRQPESPQQSCYRIVD